MQPLTYVLLFALLTILVSATAAACGGNIEPTGSGAPSSTTAPAAATSRPTASPAATSTGGVIILPTSQVQRTLTAASGADGSTSTSPTAVAAAAGAAGSPTPAGPPLSEAKSDWSTTASTDDSMRSGPSKHTGSDTQQMSPIQAGEIDDNETWDTYLEYTREYWGPEVRSTRLQERYLITVTSPSGQPVHGAVIYVTKGDESSATLRTHADGRAVHHPQDTPDNDVLTFTAQHGKTGVIVHVDRTTTGQALPLRLPTEPERPQQTELDVLFLLDATGSMADEIDRLKDTLTSIARQITDLPTGPALSMGMVAFRDRTDDYVTRVFDFDDDPARFVTTVQGVHAAGGGDYPESLNQALHDALTETGWRTDAVKLVFLVADAPPHLDYPQDEDYVREMDRAQKHGIKIFAVASSGLDEQGEYIFRQLAQQTMGRFIFILYESPPQGELTTPHEVGTPGEDFSVENLDRLIVRLITEELESMTGSQR